MPLVDDYVFDNERLIIYGGNLDFKDVSLIKSKFEKNDLDDEAKESVASADFYKLSAENKLPINAGICLTYKCQLCCDYCGFSSSSGSGFSPIAGDILAFAKTIARNYQIRRLVANSSDKMKVYFTGGGEPTYDWELFAEIVNSAKDLCVRNRIDYEFELTTNGMLNKGQLSFVKDNFNGVMVSFDGLPAIHNRNRKTANGGETADYAIESIKALCGDGPKVTVRSTIWPKDFPSLRKMADYISETLPPSIEWNLLPVIAAGRALQNCEMEPSDKREYDFFSYYVDLLEYAKALYPELKIGTSFFPHDLSAVFCGSMHAKCLWYMPNNKLITCIESREFAAEVGYVEDGKVVFYSAYFDPLAKMAAERLEKCKNCVAYRFCKGNCPLKFLRKDPRAVRALEWECAMIKKYWTYVIKQAVKGEEAFGWRAKPAVVEGLPDGTVLLLQKA